MPSEDGKTPSSGFFSALSQIGVSKLIVSIEFWSTLSSLLLIELIAAIRKKSKIKVKKMPIMVAKTDLKKDFIFLY